MYIYLYTVDNILLFDEVFMKRLQEVRLHNETPAVSLNAAALHLQLLQQGAPPPLTCSTARTNTHTDTQPTAQYTHNTHTHTCSYYFDVMDPESAAASKNKLKSN